MSRKLIFISLLLLSKISFGQIKPGDKAPNIKITHWIKNQPVNAFLKDKFVVIDFWATWCAPCLASIAHMNTLVEKNKTKSNLIFLAMSDERKEKILPILSRITFKAGVVTDTTQQTQNDFEINSIPDCIIVDDKGFVRWTGDPKELTNDIIQEILTRKDATTINNDKKIRRDIEKQYDSLSQVYRRIFVNDSIKEYFSLGPFFSEGYGSKYSRNFTNYLQKVNIGVKLKDIISEQLSISTSQISLPADIDGVYASYCYKSEKRLKSKDVLNSILTIATLTFNEKDSIQKVLSLEVIDSNLLNKNFAKKSQDKVSHLSVSDDGKFIAMSNTPIFSIIPALENRFNCPIILSDSSFFDKPLDMMLQTDDFVTLKKSMKMYGINIIELTQTLPFVTVLHTDNL